MKTILTRRVREQICRHIERDCIHAVKSNVSNLRCIFLSEDSDHTEVYHVTFCLNGEAKSMLLHHMDDEFIKIELRR